MTEQQKKYFLTLVEEKNFTKSAEKLYVTQPSFSQCIKKLENELGAILFDRTSNPIILTDEGKAVYEALSEIQTITENLKTKLNMVSNLKTGNLSIGVTPFRGSTLLSRSIKKFHSSYSGIKVNIVEKNFDKLLSCLLSGECDFAIGSGIADEKFFHKEVLAPETIYMAVNSNNPFCKEHSDNILTADDIKNFSSKIIKAKSYDLSKFKDIPFILLKGHENITHVSNQIISEYKPNISFKAQDIYTVFSFILEDLGCSLIPDTFIKYGNINKQVSYFPIPKEYSKNSINLYTKKSKQISKAATEYCTILKELIVSGTWR